MKALMVDFTMNRGHKMIITRSPSIVRTQLEELELQILQFGNIPFLLPVDWLEMDGGLSFIYNLDGVSMLVHRLQRAPFTMDQFYHLVLGIVDALTSCEDYMLRLEGCLLHEQFVYIGEQWHDIKLTYMPLLYVKESVEYRSLLSLIMHCTLYIEQLDGASLQQILRCFQSDDWPIELLRATALRLIEQREKSSIQTVSINTKQEKEEIQKSILVNNEMKREKLDRNVTQHTRKEDVKLGDRDKIVNVTEEVEEVNGKEIEIEVEAEIEQLFNRESSESVINDKRKRVTIVIAFLFIAFVWRFIYFVDFTNFKLYISIALTCFIIAVAYIIARSEKTKSTYEEDEWDNDEFDVLKQKEKVEIAEEKFDSFLRKQSYRSIEEGNQNREQQISTMQAWDGSFQHKQEKPAEELLQKDQTSEAAAIPPTTVLSLTSMLETSDSEQSDGRDQSFSLQRSWAGEPKKFNLSANLRKVTVGRTAVIKDDAIGVSRLHLEVERKGESYYIKDLGSQNGSTLNEIPMVPYKSYRLQLADKVQLAGIDGPIYELIAT
ncbi:DUF6382 domain-containing protein [Paenibacillus yanchengensis]|uniref:DUF6382 domain-containing protein n=1 Tax=Paenibacillus yanchengensis TaxID=2035833 RepID=A0ABW4YG58_9BACL